MNIKVIINSRTIRKRRRWIESIISKKLNQHNIDIEQTRYPGHAIEISGAVRNKSFDAIVAVGGDGTINEVINGMNNSKIALGIIPTGTANDFATHLKIPKDTERACDLINTGKRYRYDLIRVNGWNYITSGGIGLPCDVLRVIDKDRNRRRQYNPILAILGSHLYSWALARVLISGSHRANRIRMEINGHRYDLIASTLIIGNQPCLGGHYQVLPNAANTDGFFDLCLIEYTGSLFCLVRTLLKVLKGKHSYRSDVKIFHAQNILIESSNPIDFYADGEIKLKDTNFNVQIMPKAIQIISPAGS